MNQVKKEEDKNNGINVIFFITLVLFAYFIEISKSIQRLFFIILIIITLLLWIWYNKPKDQLNLIYKFIDDVINALFGKYGKKQNKNEYTLNNYSDTLILSPEKIKKYIPILSKKKEQDLINEENIKKARDDFLADKINNINKINNNIRNNFYRGNQTETNTLLSPFNNVNKGINNENNMWNFLEAKTTQDTQYSDIESQFQKRNWNQDESLYIYLNLKKTRTNSNSLEKGVKSYNYEIEKIPRELQNLPYHIWIKNFKNFVFDELLSKVVKQHDDNMSNLNSLLSPLGIIMTNSVCFTPPDYLSKINDNLKSLNINFSENQEINFNNENRLKYNLEEIFKRRNLNNAYFESTLYNKNELNYIDEDYDCKYIRIFFGDNEKFNDILNLLKMKYNENRLFNEQESEKAIQIGIIKKNNPFNINSYSYSNRELLINRLDRKFSINNLKKFIMERMIINKRLFPYELLNKLNEQHKEIVIEYSIQRISDLIKNEVSYSNISGGEFYGNKWCSLLPTDSQLISHLILNYFESFLKSQNLSHSFLSSFPNDFIHEKEFINGNKKFKNDIFLYQINQSNFEPIFNVVFKGCLIPCQYQDNLFQSFVIYFYFLSKHNKEFISTLGINDFINYIIK